MRMLKRKAVTVLTLFMFMALATMGVAHAADFIKHGNCRADGDTMFGTVYYSTVSGGVWVDRVSFTIQDNLAHHNNVYLRLRGDSGNTTYWAWTSGDDIVGEGTISIPVNEFAPRSANPYVKLHVIFDQYGPDPSCDFYIKLY